MGSVFSCSSALERVAGRKPSAALTGFCLLAISGGVALPEVAAGQGAPAVRPGKLRVPVATQQERAEKRIRADLGEKYGKDDPESRLALARELLRRAALSRTPAVKYVQLREARDLAAQAGDPDLALQAAEGIVAAFAVDPFDERTAALSAAAPRAATRTSARRLAGTALGLFEEAVAVDRYEKLCPLASIVVRSAARAGDLALYLRGTAQVDRAIRLESEWRFAKGSVEKLRRAPQDDKANLIAGRFYCKVKADWPRGLASLARCSDKELRSLAERDLAGPADAVRQAGLGDEWLRLADRRPGATGDWMRDRAAQWYRKALPGLAEQEKETISLRLRSLPRATALHWTKLPLKPPRPTATVGGGGGGAFQDVPTEQALLTGFKVTFMFFGGASRIIKSVQPVYITAGGTVGGGVYGGRGCGPWEVVARPGYAVGAITAKGGHRVDGFRVTFMRVAGGVLDTEDSYESGWIGGRGGGAEKVLGGDGSLVVGIHGRRGHDLDGIGLLLGP